MSAESHPPKLARRLLTPTLPLPLPLLLLLPVLAACGARSDLLTGDGDAPGTTSINLSCEPGEVGSTEAGPLADASLNPGDLAVGGGYVWVVGWPFGAQVARVPLAGGAPEILSDDRPNPEAVVAHGGIAFWIDTGFDCGRGTLSRIDADGRVTELLGGLARPKALAVDDRLVYVGDGPEGPCAAPGRITRVGHDGGRRRTLADGRSQVRSLALIDDRVFWVESSGRLASVRTDGGAITEIAEIAEGGGLPRRLVAFDGDLFVSTGSSIARVSATDGDVELLLEGGCVEGLAVDAAGVFFTCRDFNGRTPTGLFHLDPVSLGVTQLHEGSDNLTDVEVDALRLYWADLGDREFSVWTACKQLFDI